MKNLAAQELSTLFNCLHDGGFESYEAHSPTEIILRINCLYVAERVNSTFSFFKLRLTEVSQLQFFPWEESIAEAQVLVEKEQIFVGDLEILDAEFSPTDGAVHVTCNQTDSTIAWVSGTLIIACAAFNLWDEGGKEVTVAELQEITRNYWDNWKSRNA